jgi:hypothetical protein
LNEFAPPRQLNRYAAHLVMTKQTVQVYAVVRFDEFNSQAKIEERVSVTKIVSSIETAEAEVARLNKLNGSKGVTYFWQKTRLRDDDQTSDAT